MNAPTPLSEELPPLPAAFQERLALTLPADRLPAVLDTFAAAKPAAFRVNTLLADVATVRAELAVAGLEPQPVAWLPEAFTVPAGQRRALTETAAFREGRLYVQNLSSMIAPLALAPEPEESVLDLAAAPGGKTLHLAALLGGRAGREGSGRLVAVEAVRGRYYKMKANLAQHGAAFVECYQMDGRAAGRRWPAVFDRILLDAPCSSEARFTRLDPRSWAHWTPRKVKESAHKQFGLVRSALAALKPGGALLYCTCSFAPEENELVIHDQLERYGEAIAIEPLTLPLANVQPGLPEWRGRPLRPELAGCARILPTAEMDGFFLGKLRKRPT